MIINPLFPIEYIVLIYLVFAVYIIYTSKKSSYKAPKKIQIMLIVLRLLVLTILGVIALNPSKWEQEQRTSKSELAILLDTSESMKVKDVNSDSRFAQGKKIVNEILKIDPNTVIYPFDKNLKNPLKSVSELSSLQATGDGTRITATGTQLLHELSGNNKSLKGLIIISDGQETERKSNPVFPVLARSKNIPLYGICTGGIIHEKNIILKALRQHYIVFKGQSQKIKVQLTNKNLGPVSTSIDILDEKGKVLKTQKVEIKNNETKNIDFLLKLKDSGDYNLKVKTSKIAGEKTYSDNQTEIILSVSDRKLNVLMLEGLPFWDSKFLSQLLRKNISIDFTDVYRLTAKRFFMTSENSVDKESENVIFPATVEDAAKYNVIIFGKGSEFFLNNDRISILKHYVRDYGGAVILARGKPYSGTWDPLKDISPIDWGEQLDGEFRLKPVDSDEQNGLFGEMLPSQDDQIWNDLPNVQKLYTCPNLKSFSEVMMLAKNTQLKRAIPFLIKRKYGKGIILAVNGEGLWKWDFFPLAGKTADFYKNFWTQLIYWGIRYSDFLPNTKYALFLSTSNALPGEKIIAQINSKTKSISASKLKLEILKKDKVIKTIIPAQSSPETLRATFSLNNPGKYKIYIDSLDDKQKHNRIFKLINIKAPASEKDKLSADKAHLANIIMQGGGKMLSSEELLKSLKNNSLNNTVNKDETKKLISIWNSWYLLLIILGCLSFEYFFRRRNGML